LEIIDLKTHTKNKELQAIEEAAKVKGPENRTFEINHMNGSDQATGILITTASFIAVGIPTTDGMGMDFELLIPMPHVLSVKRLSTETF
jgi:hypothetical protein